MHPLPASATPSLIDDWEIVDETDAPIPHQPVDELRIALQEANPDRARAAIDLLRDQTDRRKIDVDQCLRHLLDALGDSALSRANPAAAVYVDALVALKKVMSQKHRHGGGRWSEDTVAKRLEASMPALLGQAGWPTDERRPAAATRFIERIATFMRAGLVSPKRGLALMQGATGGLSLAQKAVRQGDQHGKVFAAVVKAYADAARTGTVQGPALMSLMQATTRGRTLLGEAALRSQPVDIAALLDAAREALDAKALSQDEYRRLVTESGPSTDVLPVLCGDDNEDAGPLASYLHALSHAERTGTAPAGLLAGILQGRDSRGAFQLRQIDTGKAGVVRDILDQPDAAGSISTAARAAIRQLLPR